MIVAAHFHVDSVHVYSSTFTEVKKDRNKIGIIGKIG